MEGVCGGEGCAMACMLGYMVSWRTYGSWLPGREEGYRVGGGMRPGGVAVWRNTRGVGWFRGW